MRSLLVALVFVLASATAAHAEEPVVPPATCFAHPERWAFDRDHETSAAPGERFLEDMHTCAPTLWADVVEAVRYQIQSEEAEKFVRSRKIVTVAYGIAWAALAAVAFTLWLRQRRLAAEIGQLEARLRDAESKGGGKA
jgi:hypothetical protein